MYSRMLRVTDRIADDVFLLGKRLASVRGRHMDEQRTKRVQDAG